MKSAEPDHPITITPTAGRVVVKAGGKVIADSRRALTLQEGSCPPVQYIPREDAHMSELTRSAQRTQCPYKGDAAYYGIGSGENVVWSYEQPFPAVAAIAGHLAFYPNKVDSIEIEP